MELVWDILLDALADSGKMLPFLLLAYLLMEAAEHHVSGKMEGALRKMGKAGPLVGSLLGCLPQCGFSATAANLFAAGLVTPGTLLAVFLATSDEAVPLMLGSEAGREMILPLLLRKAAVGVLAGYLVDLVLWRDHKRHLHELCGHCGCDDNHGILRPALWHTVHIWVFILLVNILLNGAMELLGQERISALLLSGSIFQPFAAALIGLIPNCAASVMLTQLYLAGSLSFGACLAGLCSGAGIGLAVLLKMNQDKKENLRVILMLYLISALCGVGFQLFF